LLWFLGYAGPRYYGGLPETGGIVHILLVVVAILLILWLVGAI
jgi:hypothetical protein